MMILRKSFLAITVVAVLRAAPIFAMSDTEYDAASAIVNAKYQPVYDVARREGDDIKRESETCMLEIGFDADWELTKVSFDVPEVFLRNREMSFHTLKSKISQKVISKTKIPVLRAGTTRVLGVKVPMMKQYMEMHEVKIPVPEFWWAKTSFSMKIPEFRSKRIEWKFHILKFKELQELNAPCKEEKDRSSSLGASMQSTADAHVAELNTLTRNYLAAKERDMVSQRADLGRQFDSGIAALDEAIGEARKLGIDPAVAKVNVNGTETTMLASREELLAQKAKALADFDVSHEKLREELAKLG